ncbi:MAG: metallophosphoesterase [Clostridia bacterium]|nr:metallophosphoesterase [Clostridia bacterium]
MKKTIAVILSIILICGALSTGAFAVGEAKEETLKFNKDGKFKIMLFADSQDDENLEETTSQLMCEALDKYTPDLVVYLGDNTVADGYENQYKAITAATKPVRDRNIPYSIVFGNHDQEHNVAKEDLLKIYQELGGCLTYDADPDIYGCGNCNLPIMSSDGQKVAFNLWFIDSGSNNTDEGASGYDYVHPDQLEWYKRTAKELAAANGGKPVPAFDFQHIVIPEIYDAIHVKLPFSLGDLSFNYCGNSYSLLPVFSRLNGYWLEHPCPPSVYDGQLDAWLEAGDVIAEFHGHDHTNSYNVNIKGIDVVNVPTVGCNSYSKDINRGVGLITLDEKNPADYKYELLHIFDFALEDGSKICEVDGGGSKAHYGFYKALDSVLSVFFEVVNIFKGK